MQNPKLQQGIQAAKAGDNAPARALLIQVVQQDVNNELAWIWLAQVMDDPARKLDCLQQALRINPDNAPVRKAIQSLSQPPQAISPEPAESSWEFEEAEEEVPAFDSAWKEEEEPEPSGDWDATQFSETEEEASSWDFNQFLEPSAEDESDMAFESAPAAGEDSEETWDFNQFLEPSAEDESDMAFESAPAAGEDSEETWDFNQFLEPSAEDESDMAFESAPAAGADSEETWDFEDLWSEESEGTSAVFVQEADAEPATESEDVFDWGDALDFEAEPASTAERPPAAEAPSPSQVPVFEFDGDLDAALGLDEEEEAEESPEPEPVPERRLSLLDRNRMAQIRASQPQQPAAPVLPSEPDTVPEAQLPSKPAVDTPVQPRAPAKERRRFRFMDMRVLFGLLGIIDIPIIALLVFLLWGGRPPASPSDAVLATCAGLDRAGFSIVVDADTVGGQLSADTVFTTSTVYHIQSTLVISPDRRVLVEPGAQLVFAEGAALDVYGDLYVCGTEADPVIFTSEEKEPGSWQGIRVYEAGDKVLLNHAKIHFAGDRALYLERSAPILANLLIANSALFPISVEGSVFPDLSLGIDLRDNPFKAVEIRQGALPPGNVIWPDTGFVYVISGLLNVGGDTTLEIEPGVVIKVWPGNSRVSGLWVRGLLKAQNVYFTSAYDSREQVGGVTYLESKDPAPGDWGGITFFGSSENCTLSDVTVRYAGAIQRGALALHDSAPQLTNVTLVDSAWYPLSLDANSVPVLENLTLTDNAPGDAVEIRSDVVLTGSGHSWGVLGGDAAIVRVIQGPVTISPGAELTLEPGIVLKFSELGKLIVKGTLNAVGGGGENNRIVLTSLHDDDYGGNTDGAIRPGELRAWEGILFEQAGDASIMQNTVMRYAGVRVARGAPRLINNQILDSAGPGIALMPSAQPELLNNQLERNSIDGIEILTGTMTIDQNWARLGEYEDQIVRVLVGEVVVAEDVTLRVGPGVVIKGERAGKLVVSGTLQAPGMGHMPVTLTSLRDDGVGGDTDREIEDPEAGDWQGLVMGANAEFVSSYVQVFYAEIGLELLGEQAPVVENGYLQISQGVHALRCAAAVEFPTGLLVEENEFNENRCPTRW